MINVQSKKSGKGGAGDRDCIFSVKSRIPSSDTAIESKIGGLMYKLYGLGEAEVATVEGFP